MNAETSKRCPCGSGEPYDACCEPILRGVAPAATAEHLMRSRYTAFAVGDRAYVSASWHPRTRPAKIDIDPEQRWMFLEILETVAGGLFDTQGTVEFRAHYRANGKRGVLHERSRFVRMEKRWVYLDGERLPD